MREDSKPNDWRNNMRLLKWAAILMPTVFFVLMDIFWENLSSDGLRPSDSTLIHIMIAAAIITISYTIVNLISRLQKKITQDDRNSAVVQERERTAREMHDGMAQLLGYINTQTIAVRKLLSNNQLVEARDELTKMEEIARGLYADVREGILGLRISAGRRDGLQAVMREYAARYAEMSGIKVDIKVVPGAENADLSPSAEIQLTRIVQEALTNVRKHSKATSAVITFERSGSELCLTISDNGQGFDTARLPPRGWPRFGLQTMQERAQSVSGAFVIDAAPGRGCRISVRMPLSYAQKSRVKA